MSYQGGRSKPLPTDNITSGTYAPVICNHVPWGPGIAGLKYPDFIFKVSRYCPGYAGLLIPAKAAGEIAVRFYPD